VAIPETFGYTLVYNFSLSLSHTHTRTHTAHIVSNCLCLASDNRTAVFKEKLLVHILPFICSGKSGMM